MTTQCPQCLAILPPGAKLCPRCGNQAPPSRGTQSLDAREIESAPPAPAAVDSRPFPRVGVAAVAVAGTIALLLALVYASC